MKKIIFIAGAPGVGKSTISALLHKKHGFPVIDFGRMIITHLDNIRSANVENISHQKMSFEIFMKAIECHIKYGFFPVIVNDLRDTQVQQIQEYFSDTDYIIISLYVTNKEELETRILSVSRDEDSFQNASEAWAWNESLRKRSAFHNEHKIDITQTDPSKTVDEILKLSS